MMAAILCEILECLSYMIVVLRLTTQYSEPCLLILLPQILNTGNITGPTHEYEICRVG